MVGLTGCVVSAGLVTSTARCNRSNVCVVPVFQMGSVLHLPSDDRGRRGQRGGGRGQR